MNLGSRAAYTCVAAQEAGPLAGLACYKWGAVGDPQQKGVSSVPNPILLFCMDCRWLGLGLEVIRDHCVSGNPPRPPL